MSQYKRPQRLPFNSNLSKTSRNRMAYCARLRTDSSGYRELNATMHENEHEGARITAMIRDVGHGIWSGCRGVWPKPSRASPISQNHKLPLSLASSPCTHTRTFTPPARTHRRPSNIRRLSSGMRVRELHREVHGGICCVDGDI